MSQEEYRGEDGERLIGDVCNVPYRDKGLAHRMKANNRTAQQASEISIVVIWSFGMVTSVFHITSDWTYHLLSILWALGTGTMRSG